MGRTLGALLSGVLLISATACSGPPPRVPRAAGVCDGPEEKTAPEPLPITTPAWGERVLDVEITGAPRVPRSLLQARIGTKVDDPLDEAQLAADVRALLELEIFDDVVVETEPHPGGVSLRYRLTPRRVVGEVVYLGPLPKGRHLPLTPGELHDAARVHRAASGLKNHLLQDGHLDARVDTRSRTHAGRVDVCFRVNPGPRYLISQLTLAGNQRLSERELSELIDDRDGKVNKLGAPFRPDLFSADQLRMQALYYERGFLEATVDEAESTRDLATKTLRVVIPIHEGERYRLGKLSVSGRLRAPARRYRELLGMKSGEIFARSRFTAGLAEITRYHASLGHPAVVAPSTTLDAETHRIDVELQIEEASE